MPAVAGITSHIQAHHTSSPPATQSKHMQPVRGEICNPPPLRDPGCISEVRQDTCVWVMGKSSSGRVMRTGACGLSDLPGKCSVRQPWTQWSKHKGSKPWKVATYRDEKKWAQLPKYFPCVPSPEWVFHAMHLLPFRTASTSLFQLLETYDCHLAYELPQH